MTEDVENKSKSIHFGIVTGNLDAHPLVLGMSCKHFKFPRKQIANMCGSPGDISEKPVTQEKRKKGWRKICDVGDAT